jgi:hypothetical protein
MSRLVKNLIYGYVDPRSGELRYVGKSSSGTRRPLQFTAHRTRCGNWIKSLAPLRPEIVVLEELADDCTDADLNEAECHAIAYWKFLGARLTNLTLGGEGARGLEKTPETRARLSAALRGRKVSPKHKAAISAAKIGYKHTPETRAKMTALRRKPEIRAKLSAQMMGKANALGYRHTPETRARMSADMMGNTNGRRR